MCDISLFEMVHLHHLDQGYARRKFLPFVVLLLEGVNEMPEQSHKLAFFRRPAVALVHQLFKNFDHPPVLDDGRNDRWQSLGEKPRVCGGVELRLSSPFSTYPCRIPHASS